MNRPPSFLLAAITLGFLPGILIGMFLLGADAPPEAAATTSSDRVVESISGGPRADAPPVANSVVEASASERRGDDLGAFRDIMRSAARPPKDGGDGVIDGKVESEDGDPIEGALVRATRRIDSDLRPSSRGDRAPALDSLDDVVRTAVESYWKTRGASGEAVTASDGSYRIDGLGDGTYSMSAHADSWSVSARSSRAMPGQTIDFIASRVIDVTIEVRLGDANGQSVEFAGVRSRTEGSRRSTTTELWSRADPRVRLMPGQYTIHAYLDRKLGERSGIDGDWISEKIDLDVRHGGAEEAVTLVLKPQRGVRGRVLVPSGENLSSARAWLKKVEAGGAVDAAFIESGNSRYISGSGLEFEYLDLEPGRYVVGAGRSWDRRVAVHETVVVEAGVTDVELALPALDPSQSLIAVARDSAGKPLRRVTFRVSIRKGSKQSSTSLYADEDQAGRYRLWPESKLRAALAEPANVSTLELTAKTRDRGSKTLDLSKGQAAIEFRFGAPATVDVNVPVNDTKRWSGKLRAGLSPFGKGGASSRTLDADGTGRLGPVQVGDYNLTLSVRSGRSGWFQVTERPVTLGPGDNQIALSLPALHDLKVAFIGATGSRVYLQIGSSSVRADIVDGEAQFSLLPAGLHSLRAEVGGSWRTMKVAVPTSGTVTFKAAAQDAARMKVEDGGWLASVGFEDGDLVVAVDGRSFESEDELKAFLISGGDECRLSIERGGGTTTLAVDGKKLALGSGLGGGWTSIGR